MDDFTNRIALALVWEQVVWEHCLTNILVIYVDKNMMVRMMLQQTFLLSSALSTSPLRLSLLTVKAKEMRQWRRVVVRGPNMMGRMMERRMLVNPNPDQGDSLTEQGISTS